jgi:hypothetical protein
LALRASELELPFFRISAVTGAGVGDLLEAAWLRLAEARQQAASVVDAAAQDAALPVLAMRPVIDETPDPSV